MFQIVMLTVKSMMRDRIFMVILSMIILFALVPIFSSFSMRQIQEISITTALTLNSSILLFLAIFGGVATIWRDIERKHTYTVLSYPISRSAYFIGRFIGFVLIMLLVTLINYVVSVGMISMSAATYKSQLPILWGTITVAFFMAFLKYVLLMAFGFLFSAFSTSFFTPFFSTVAIYLAGNASQGIYDYIMQNTSYSTFFKTTMDVLYRVVPNFSSFDFTANASYSLPVNTTSVWISAGYFCVYLVIVTSFSVMIFSRRDMM